MAERDLLDGGKIIDLESDALNSDWIRGSRLTKIAEGDDPLLATKAEADVEELEDTELVEI